jgi:hypothetical protein
MWPLHSRSRPLGHSFMQHGPPRFWRLEAGPSSRATRAADANANANAHASHTAKPLSARRVRWQSRLSSRAFHIIVLLLVLLDLCTIVADLVLVLTHSTYSPTHAVEAATRALSATSLAILSLFVVEFVAAAVVFGPRVWFSEPLHVFDVFVVGASLALEAALFHLEAQEFEGLVSLLVAGRLWRLARVAYTATEATKAEEEVVAHRHAKARERELEGLRRRVASLRAQLAEAGVVVADEKEDEQAEEEEEEAKRKQERRLGGAP